MGHDRERAVKHKMTGSVVRKSTTDVIAPATQARRDRNVKHLPRHRRTAERASRPNPATQLQHSDGQKEIHVQCFLFIQADGSPPVPGPYRPANRSSRYQLPIGAKPATTSTILRARKFYKVLAPGKYQFSPRRKFFANSSHGDA
jgi:hypothetical protein